MCSIINHDSDHFFWAAVPVFSREFTPLATQRRHLRATIIDLESAPDLIALLLLRNFSFFAQRIPLPREKAPSFEATAVLNDDFTKVALSDYTSAGKWLVLFFYPFDYTFVCPTEIRSFSDAAAKFAKINTGVAAVSTDSHHTHLSWTRTARENGGVGKLDIPLLADTGKKISYDYGVLVTEPTDDMFGAALRGVFIIDPSGTVRSVTVNDDGAGRNVDEVLRTVQALQYADNHEGEACPANWKPGDKTIKTDPNGSKEFFKDWA